MSRRLWLDPSFGASGDMLLGCLVGLLGTASTASEAAIVDELREAVRVLGVDGWTLDHEAVTRCGIAATQVSVATAPATARTWTDIDQMLQGARLAPAVTEGARRTFRMMAEVEAAQHRIAVDEVHFHEVGAVDAIVDVVGVWWLRDRLDVDEVVVGPVGLGHGTVRAAHGVLPLPAPATMELLRGAPVRSLDAAFETCTPTGAALLRSLGSWGPIPNGTVAAVARGAGGKDPATHPNVVTAVLIDGQASSTHRTDAVVLTTNVDDVTPEVLARVVELLLREGADDAWITPIVMKKGRPAHQLSALCTPALSDTLRALIGRETGTLGIRSTTTDKFVRNRDAGTVHVRGTEIRIKIGPDGVKAEFADLAGLSDRTGVPVRDLALEAISAWRDAR